jgi:hypothetical protein
VISVTALSSQRLPTYCKSFKYDQDTNQRTTNSFEMASERGKDME